MDIKLLRLMQLISPALPVGGYAYSQGLESAIESGYVLNEQDTQDWIGGLLMHSLANLDLPVISLMSGFIRGRSAEKIQYLNYKIIALRETLELRNEATEMGKALKRLIYKLPNESIDSYKDVVALIPVNDLDWAISFSFAVELHEIEVVDAMSGFAWAWCESQVAAAIKLLPLGQTSGQAILHRLSENIPEAVKRAICVSMDELGSSTPNLAIMSSNHEIQYSRLFRS